MPTIKAKRKCCKKDTRCKTCPVALHRLVKWGHAEKIDKRRYDVDSAVPKKTRKLARKR